MEFWLSRPVGYLLPSELRHTLFGLRCLSMMAIHHSARQTANISHRERHKNRGRQPLPHGHVPRSILLLKDGQLPGAVVQVESRLLQVIQPLLPRLACRGHPKMNPRPLNFHPSSIVVSRGTATVRCAQFGHYPVTGLAFTMLRGRSRT